MGELDGDETYRLIGADGKVWSSGRMDGSIDITNIPGGFYILVVENAKGLGSFRVIVGE